LKLQYLVTTGQTEIALPGQYIYERLQAINNDRLTKRVNYFGSFAAD